MIHYPRRGSHWPKITKRTIKRSRLHYRKIDRIDARARELHLRSMAQIIHQGSDQSGAILSVRIGDAIRITGIGRTKLFALIADGTLETTTIGRRRLILYRSLQRLIEGTAPSAPPANA